MRLFLILCGIYVVVGIGIAASMLANPLAALQIALSDVAPICFLAFVALG